MSNNPPQCRSETKKTNSIINSSPPMKKRMRQSMGDFKRMNETSMKTENQRLCQSAIISNINRNNNPEIQREDTQQLINLTDITTKTYINEGLRFPIDLICKTDIPNSKLKTLHYSTSKLIIRKQPFMLGFIYLYDDLDKTAGMVYFFGEESPEFHYENFNDMVKRTMLSYKLYLEQGHTLINIVKSTDLIPNTPIYPNDSQYDSNKKTVEKVINSIFGEDAAETKFNHNLQTEMVTLNKFYLGIMNEGIQDNNSNENGGSNNNNAQKQHLQTLFQKFEYDKILSFVPNEYQTHFYRLNLKDEDTNEEENPSKKQEDKYTYESSINIHIPQSMFDIFPEKPYLKHQPYNKVIISRLFITHNIFTSLLSKPYISIVMDIKAKKHFPITEEYNGLINEGMTCYMNSLMQSLNALGPLKRSIFSIPYDPSENSLSYSLQRLFYDLSFEKKSASTQKLTRSFGWSIEEIFIQNDIQEFNMMLSDLMEQKFKGTNNEDIYKKIFKGEIKNQIKCIDYNYESIKKETFNDIQLNVKGCKDIYESLSKFTEEEILDGDDKYEVEGHGKEKAVKSIKFLSLPNVLMLQLKRFEYNPQKDQMDKLNDKFEFYDEINLSKFLQNEKAESNTDPPSNKNDDITMKDVNETITQNSNNNVTVNFPVKIVQENRSNKQSQIISNPHRESNRKAYESTPNHPINNNNENDIAVNDDCTYKLLSVVVHKGNLYGGHYYAFIRPKHDDDTWYCFNDETVTIADKYDVFDANFGGSVLQYRYKDSTNSILEQVHKSDSSAYILLYIKKNISAQILKPIEITDIPSEILKMIRRDKKKEKKEEQQRIKEKNNINVVLITKETLLDYKGFGFLPCNVNIYLIEENKFNMVNNNLITINVSKKLQVSVLYEIISKYLNIQSNFILLFHAKETGQKITNRFNWVLEYFDAKKLKLHTLESLLENKMRRIVFYVGYLNTTTLPLIINEKTRQSLNLYDETSNENEDTDSKKKALSNSDEDDMMSISDEQTENEKDITLSNEKKIKVYRKLYNDYSLYPMPLLMENTEASKILVIKKVSLKNEEITTDEVFTVTFNQRNQFNEIRSVEVYFSYLKEQLMDCYNKIDRSHQYELLFYIDTTSINSNTFPNENLTEESEMNEEENKNDPFIKYVQSEVIKYRIPNLTKIIFGNFQEEIYKSLNDTVILIPALIDMEDDSINQYNLKAFRKILKMKTCEIFLNCKTPCSIDEEEEFEDNSEEEIINTKLKFYLFEGKEDIQYKILNNVNKEKLLNYLNKSRRVKGFSCIYMNQQNLLISYEEFVTQYIQPENININEKNKKYKSYENMKDFPLFEFINNSKDIDIEYDINTFVHLNTNTNNNSFSFGSNPYQPSSFPQNGRNINIKSLNNINGGDNQEIFPLLINISDKHFNTSVNVDFFINLNELSLFKNNIDFIKHIKQRLFESIYTKNKSVLDNLELNIEYDLILIYNEAYQSYSLHYYHEQRLFETLVKRNIQNEGNSNYEYLLMPLSLNCENKKMISIIFKEEQNIILGPVPIFYNEERDKISDIKQQITNIIEHNSAIQTHPNIDVHDIKKRKMYLFTPYNGEINKDVLILNEKDDEIYSKFSNISQSRGRNILIEFIKVQMKSSQEEEENSAQEEEDGEEKENEENEEEEGDNNNKEKEKEKEEKEEKD